MLSRTLLLFVGIGVVAGLAFGVYLLDIKNAGQPEFVEGPSVSVLTERSDYESGEIVSIRIINSGTVPLSFTNTAFGWMVTDLSGVVVHSPYAGRAVTVMGPGGEASATWDPLNESGISEGIYKISSGGWHGDEYVEDTAVITIWK